MPNCCGDRGPIQPIGAKPWSPRRRFIPISPRASTRREMVTRELKSLERAGLLTKRRGAFVLTNVPELVQMIDNER
jgi:hypothetical protein